MTPTAYWSRLLKLFLHYRKRAQALRYPPVRLWVELTSLCNYRCIMCPNKSLKKEDRGFMAYDLYKKIVDEAKGFAFDINLAHRGESLLHPQLPEAILYAKKSGLFTRLHTNGSLLTEELSQKIIQSGLDRVSFSFDGFDKQTYERIREGGDFDGTMHAIVRFLEIKKRLGAKHPITAIEVIDFDARTEESLEREKKRFLKSFENLRLDHFVVKKAHNWAGELGHEAPRKRYTVCPFPWNALIITWDGSVLPCTQDFFGAYILGNASEKRLLDIWNGKEMQALRRKLAEGDIQNLKACSKCDRVWRDSFLGVPKEYLWKFVTKRMP